MSRNFKIVTKEEWPNMLSGGRSSEYSPIHKGIAKTFSSPTDEIMEIDLVGETPKELKADAAKLTNSVRSFARKKGIELSTRRTENSVFIRRKEEEEVKPAK